MRHVNSRIDTVYALYCALCRNRKVFFGITERILLMKKFIFVLFDVLGFVLKLFLLFSLAIIGMDLINKHNEEKLARKD